MALIDAPPPHAEAGAGPASVASAPAVALGSQALPGMWRRFRRNRLAVCGLAVVGLEALAALLAPVITFTGPTTLSSASRAGPSAAHWFGTDLLGRDLYSRVVYGARVSLRVGIGAVVIALVIGVVAGALAGWYGRAVDALVMRVTDVFLAFPYILAAIAVVTVVGRGQRTVILVLGLLGWMPIARLLRSGVLAVKQREYVEAARAVGCGDLRILTRHVLPNAVQPVIVYATIFVGAAVLTEAALSFLGTGITEPTPAWGLMVAQGRSFLFTSPHLLLFPGAAVLVTVTAFVLVGDGLRDALDPRWR
jgi:peptide/nickel transport system permease protein